MQINFCPLDCGMGCNVIAVDRDNKGDVKTVEWTQLAKACTNSHALPFPVLSREQWL